MTMMTRLEKQERLQKIRCFVLDMDGTIYLGNRLFPYTPAFLQAVTASGRDYCYFTNNSSKNARTYLEKLSAMGIPVPPEKMLVSNGVLLRWLGQNRPGISVYVVGTPALEADFRRAGVPLNDQNPDAVVLGFDTTLTYEKLETACRFIRQGSTFYGVNPDWNCPTENGFLPDCGSIAALITASTGVSPEFFGKPSRHTLEYLLAETGCREEELAIVGDRLYTDIQTAQGTGVTSILVFSGETQPEDLKTSAVQPDLTCQDLGELASLLKGLLPL